ncbi:hypothetical protein C1Y30_19080 [Pseudomonas sp. GW704-F3]|nr:hypothetical protein C1Y30_19080 [Pseudomonas sp. GW704-F3]PMU97644.1 hypothetical protein C1Y28_00310 [Pseudomonas sp. GW704-F5]PMV08738.1 hypothetical protein C1Y29_00230 [Pseudomonas sp. MPBD4-3]PMV35718.1 hypothetical protein C1Y27_02085 [Pseudomonas sp. GW704-F2]
MFFGMGEERRPWKQKTYRRGQKLKSFFRNKQKRLIILDAVMRNCKQAINHHTLDLRPIFFPDTQSQRLPPLQQS